ncbi:hypothetical protein [Butyrivibrio proteoclasticus]|uniref:hypothetical protein n=1 Tax=Butyrivibrio proteoclasticus TaxID=43305 RepID=UPI00047BBE55|nr:hypothetical protein [Butyrivibrio proteoclasticus]
MDKVEYRIRADEIKALIGEGRFAEAVKIADTIDWKRVKNVTMLCKISDLYKINRRYEESRDVLLMAYDRHPTGRAIVYSLCELAIKMGEFVQAVEYYKEFVRIAPRDTGRYILQYKLYEAQEVSLEERIAVLEELKKHDYTERWAYELAYLYHRVGLTTECIEECDEMFLWFGDGRYVMKALELKALHEPLSPEQQDRYVRYKENHGGFVSASQQPVQEEQEPAQEAEETLVVEDLDAPVEPKQPTKEMPPITDEVIREYNMTRDTAKAAPVSEEPVYQEPVYQEPVYEEQTYEEPVPEDPVYEDTYVGDGMREIGAVTGDVTADSEPEASEDNIVYPHISEIKEPSVDVSAFNTMNLQEALAEGLKEVIGDDDTQPELGIDIKYGGNGPILGSQTGVVYENKPLEDEVPGAVIHPNANYQMPTHFEKILSQEYDGQISMAVETEPEVEKQITGQISIADYMNNWEQFKKDQQQKQLERVKKRVADETGNMFADYDQQRKEGLQEKIEKSISDALKKERHDKASGRGDWSVKSDDVIAAAVDETIEREGLIPMEEIPDDDMDDDITLETAETEAAVEETESEEKAAESEESVDTPVEDVEDAEDTEEVTEASEDTEESEDSVEPTDNSEPETPEDEEAEESEDQGDVEESDSEKAEDLEKAEDSDTEEAEESAKPEEPAKAKKENKEKQPHHIGNRELEERVRTMTPEEKELFGPYIHHKKSRRQIINAIDNMSMDAFSGNAIVTGEEGAGTVNLAKGLIKAMQVSDSNFSGKVAKITANTLNKKSTASIFEKLANGALIIQRAADLEAETVSELIKILQEENKGLIIVMEDTKEDMDKFLDKNPSLKQSFNVRVDIEALDDDSLVAYAKQYALEREYTIDNLGILALHTRIADRQTLDHEVTVSEVKDIVDDAIYYAEKRTIGHFMDVIVNKRYDENDMIILREKDFMH